MHDAQIHWSACYLTKTIIILNFQWGKWGLEGWSDLPKVTQVVSKKGSEASSLSPLLNFCTWWICTASGMISLADIISIHP